MGRYVSLRNRVQAVGLTDTGKVREHNEDAIGSNADIGLMVLADGMGGYNAGEVASGIAVQDHYRIWQQRAPCTEKRNDVDSHDRAHAPVNCIARRRCARQQDHLPDRAKSDALRGHGNHPRGCNVLRQPNIPCSCWRLRAYRLRGERFEQLTLDHSLLQELVDRGFYSEEEAQRSTNRNYVTRALGVEPTVEVEVQEYDVEPGDVYLLVFRRPARHGRR